MFYQWFSTKGERFPFRVEWLPLLVHNSAADSREHSRVAKYKVRGGGKKSIESSASFGSRRRTEKRKIPGGRLAPPITNGIYSTTSPLVRRRSVFSGGGERSAVGRGGKKIYTDSNSMKGDFDPRTEFLPSSRYLPGIIYRCRDVRTSLEHSRIVKRVLTLYSSRQRFFFFQKMAFVSAFLWAYSSLSPLQ